MGYFPEDSKRAKLNTATHWCIIGTEPIGKHMVTACKWNEENKEWDFCGYVFKFEIEPMGLLHTDEKDDKEIVELDEPIEIN